LNNANHSLLKTAQQTQEQHTRDVYCCNGYSLVGEERRCSKQQGVIGYVGVTTILTEHVLFSDFLRRQQNISWLPKRQKFQLLSFSTRFSLQNSNSHQ